MRRLFALIAAAALAVPLAGLLYPTAVNASSSVRAFTPQFSVNAQGAITMIGNTLETCQASAACTTAQAGTAVPATDNNNNVWTMAYVDADTDGSTNNSSAATLSLPAGATVLFAELTWAGISTSAQRGVARFKVPGGSYVDVSATRIDQVVNSGTNYSAIADVTSLVAGLANPNGTYWVANVQSTIAAVDRYAAWTLIVAYQDLTVPLRNLVVFDGYALVNGTAPISISTTVSGFLTPAIGPVQTKIGAVVYEGDIGYVNDSMQLNGTTLSNALNPAANFFNSSMTIDGTRFSAKTPDYVNQMAFDADIVDASGILANSATSATITYTSSTTNYDTYYPSVVTFQTDVFTPVVDVVKTSQNMTHTDAIYTGDVIRYTLTATSTGNDPATFVVLTDPIPAPLTYVPGSAYILTGPNSDAVNPKTDALGDDQVDFSGGAVTFRLGTGANAVMGGQMPNGMTTTIQFDTTVDAVPPGTQIVNQASISYSGLTLGGGYASSSDSSTVSAGDNPDTEVTNAPPVAIPDTAVVLLNTATPISVLDNDWDPDGNVDPSSVTLISGPSNGSITSINPATGAMTYNPNTGWTGTDTFRYQVCDSVTPVPQCSQANVTVYVRTTLWTPPTARPDGASVNEGSFIVISVLANDSAGSGALAPATTTVIVPANYGSTSVNASGQITYTPTGDFYGDDYFIYQICDVNGLCDTALVSVDVLGIADPPTAVNDSATLAENSSVIVNVLANDTDPENDINITSVAVQAGPSHGTTVVNANGSITYTPTTGYYGPDSFTYRVCDMTIPTPLCSSSAPYATVSITVTQAAPGRHRRRVQRPQERDPVGSSARRPGQRHRSQRPGPPYGPRRRGEPRHADPQPRRIVRLHPHDRLHRRRLLHLPGLHPGLGLLVGGDRGSHDRQRWPGRGGRLLQRGRERLADSGRSRRPGQRHRPQRRHPHCRGGADGPQQRHPDPQPRRLLCLHPVRGLLRHRQLHL